MVVHFENSSLKIPPPLPNVTVGGKSGKLEVGEL